MTGGDTSPEAERVQIEVLRRLGVDGRLRLTLDLCESMREVLRDGVRLRHPDYSPREVELGAIRLLLGEELFAKAYPGVDVKP